MNTQLFAEFERLSERFGYGVGLGTSPDIGAVPGAVNSGVSNPAKKMNAARCASYNNLYKLRL